MTRPTAYRVALHLDDESGPLHAHRVPAAQLGELLRTLGTAFQRAAQAELTGGTTGNYPQDARRVELQFEASEPGSLRLGFVPAALAVVASLGEDPSPALEERAALRMVKEIARAGRNDPSAATWARQCVLAMPREVRQTYEVVENGVVLAEAHVSSGSLATDEARPMRRGWIREVSVEILGVRWHSPTVIVGFDGQEWECAATRELVEKATKFAEAPPGLSPIASIVATPATGNGFACRLVRLWREEEHRGLQRRGVDVSPREVVESQRGVLEFLAAYDRGRA